MGRHGAAGLADVVRVVQAYAQDLERVGDRWSEPHGVKAPHGLQGPFVEDRSDGCGDLRQVAAVCLEEGADGREVGGGPAPRGP